MKKRRKKIGLALGGGGARGLAHIGVLKVLKKEGVKIDYIAGASMGALIGAYYSLGLDLEKLEKDISSLTKTIAIRKFVDLSSPGKSILKGRKVYGFINSYLKDAKFSDTKIPLQIIAANLANGEEVIISKGSIARATRASTSVPGIFPPVKINNRYLVDGGIVNPTPVDTAENMGADIVIGVDLMLKREVKLTKEPNLVTTLLQSYEIIREQAVKLNLEKVSGDVILIKPKVKGVIESFKFYDIGKFIKAGEKAAREMLPEIRKKLK